MVRRRVPLTNAMQHYFRHMRKSKDHLNAFRRKARLWVAVAFLVPVCLGAIAALFVSAS